MRVCARACVQHRHGHVKRQPAHRVRVRAAELARRRRPRTEQVELKLALEVKVSGEIVAERGVDQVALARAFLDDPRWGWHAAEKLGVTLQLPKQFNRVTPKSWPGVKIARGG